MLFVLLLIPLAKAPPVKAPPVAAAPEAESSVPEDPPRSTPDGEDQAARVAPPRLVASEPAHYPEAAERARVEGTVVLKLTVNREGRVSDVVVLDEPGFGLGQAAALAAQRFVFEPARRDEEAVVAVILHETRFELPRQGAAPGAAQNTPVNAAPEPPKPVAAPPARVAEGADEAGVEVIVRGRSAEAELRRSARAVTVVDTREAQRQSSDLGEVLARSTPVTVQRWGGLGSASRFSLGGLSGEQVRFFIDGIPLELSGFVMGIANVPLNLIDRVEVYQGVVPVRFGSDALGGAVNVVTDQSTQTQKAGASYQVGSFKTLRATLSGQAALPARGVFARITAFADTADNDYPIDADVVDASGQLTPARLRRFHDGYSAGGATLSLGLVEQPFADRLVLTGFATGANRDIQSNPSGSVPYGEVTFEKRSRGANLRYREQFDDAWALEVSGGIARTHTTFTDTSRCRYGWDGVCLVERPLRGEINSVAIDRAIDDRTWFLRSELTWQPLLDQGLSLSFAPTNFRREGDDAEIVGDEYDFLNAPQVLTTLVAGLEHEAHFWERRLSNILFAKFYYQRTRGEERLGTGEIDQVDLGVRRSGFGDSARMFLTDEIYLKASYEYATRLPSSDETFGDGGTIERNLDLRPEGSHNLNLSANDDAIDTGLGTLGLGANGFARLSDELIVLVNGVNYQQYQNVLETRALGVDLNGTFASPNDNFGADGNLLWQRVENVSESGPHAAFYGQRIPNRPYLTAATSVWLRAHGLAMRGDNLEVWFRSRYVHEFLRGWEDVGAGDSKLTVPSQFIHSLGVGYAMRSEVLRASYAFEVQNLTDARSYDFYGIQRPGRAFYSKVTLDL